MRIDVRSVGGLEVIALLDASGPFTPLATWAEAFPEATPTDWDRARCVDPNAFDPSGAWFLHFRCFAVRRPGGRTTLVDAGVGPATGAASSWAPGPGGLLKALAEAGIDVLDVDVVILTHLHSDHVGWSTGPDGRPVFPNARYVIQRDEIRALRADRHDPVLGKVIDPLRRADQLHQVDGWAAIFGNRVRPIRPSGQPVGHLTVIPTPGHTPGHQSVLVHGRHREVLITGDVLVHAVQLVQPDVSYFFEADPVLARATRHSVMAHAADRQQLLATAHLTHPFLDP